MASQAPRIDPRLRAEGQEWLAKSNAGVPLPSETREAIALVSPGLVDHALDQCAREYQIQAQKDRMTMAARTQHHSNGPASSEPSQQGVYQHYQINASQQQPYQSQGRNPTRPSRNKRGFGARAMDGSWRNCLNNTRFDRAGPSQKPLMPEAPQFIPYGPPQVRHGQITPPSLSSVPQVNAGPSYTTVQGVYWDRRAQWSHLIPMVNASSSDSPQEASQSVPRANGGTMYSSPQALNPYRSTQARHIDSSTLAPRSIPQQDEVQATSNFTQATVESPARTNRPTLEHDLRRGRQIPGTVLTPERAAWTRSDILPETRKKTVREPRQSRFFTKGVWSNPSPLHGPVTPRDDSSPTWNRLSRVWDYGVELGDLDQGLTDSEAAAREDRMWRDE